MSLAVDVTLREAAWTDIPALAALDACLFAADAWSEATWWAEFAGRPRRAYVVLAAPPDAASPDAALPGVAESAPIVGYAGVDLGGEVADVMTIAVAPGQHGQGHGRRLLTWLEDTARRSGALRLMLEVRADNAAALGLYARAGFGTISTRRRYYQPGDVDAVIMEKDLRA